MTVTQAEAAAQLRTLGVQLNQQVAANGWNANAPYSTAITWQGPPFSIAEYIAWWGRFADARTCVPCQSGRDTKASVSLFNRRGSKDSQLR